MNVLVVGCGSMGRRRAQILSEMGRSVFVTDIEATAVSRTVAAIPGTMALYGDLCADVMFISTWAATHVELALDAVRAGAHVFIEKPPALSEDGLDELEREAAARNLKVMVGCNWRFHPALKNLSLAPPNMVTLTFAIRPSEASRQHGGGLLLDMGSHALDLFRFLFGPVSDVRWTADGPDHGILSCAAASIAGVADLRYVADGEPETRLLQVYRGEGMPLTPDPTMYEHETTHFLRAIETGSLHMNPLSEARQTLHHLLSVR